MHPDKKGKHANHFFILHKIASSKNKTEDHGYYFQDQLLVDEIHELNRKVLEHSTIPMKYDVF